MNNITKTIINQISKSPSLLNSLDSINDTHSLKNHFISNNPLLFTFDLEIYTSLIEEGLNHVDWDLVLNYLRTGIPVPLEKKELAINTLIDYLDRQDNWHYHHNIIRMAFTFGDAVKMVPFLKAFIELSPSLKELRGLVNVDHINYKALAQIYLDKALG